MEKFVKYIAIHETENMDGIASTEISAFSAPTKIPFKKYKNQTSLSTPLLKFFNTS